MFKTIGYAAMFACLPLLPAATGEKSAEPNKGGETVPRSFYDFTVKDINGNDVKLSRYKGDVCMVVNVASKCGLTKTQYAGLEELYQRYNDRGFEILAFPANNFLRQEPGTNAEISQFCRTSMKATFPLFAKISVKGKDQAPLYEFLTQHPDKKIAGKVAWNFQKYLIDREGKVIAKFSPKVKPTAEQVIEAVENALKAPKPAKESKEE
jgi:glutathione peroxidase